MVTAPYYSKLHASMHHSRLVVLSLCLMMLPYCTPDKSFTVELIRSDHLVEQTGEEVEVVIDNLLVPHHSVFKLPVEVGTGIRKKRQNLIFDTGSNLTWLKCDSPYFNDGTIFKESSSPTYKVLTRKDNYCIFPGPEDLCYFTKRYADGTEISGIVSRDTFGFRSPAYPFKKMVFGCVHPKASPNSMHDVPGIFAMGNGKLSFARQLQESYGNVFTYCLAGRYTGDQSFLTLGGSMANDGQRTKVILYEGRSHYYVNLKDIGFEDRRFGMSQGIFDRKNEGDSGGCIFDTGTDTGVLTEEPYKFVKEQVKAYFREKGLDLANDQDPLCYLLPDNYQDILPAVLPTMIYYLSDGAEFKIRGHNMFYVTKRNMFCWAMRQGIRNVIGAILQADTRITYDINKLEMAFVSEKCAVPVPAQ